MSINLSDLINIAPDVLKFITPGFFFILVFTKLACVKIESTEKWILSAVISFASISFIESSVSALNRTITIWELSFCCITVCVAGGAILAWLWSSDWAKEFIKSNFGATLFDGALNNAIDWNKSSYVCVYLKSTDDYYTGNIVMTDENKDGWLTISAPVLRNCKDTVIVSHDGELDVIMVIPIADVKRIKVINK